MKVIGEVSAVVGVVCLLGLACGGEGMASGPEASSPAPTPSEGTPLPPPPQVLSICPWVRTYLQDGSLHEEKWLDSQGRTTHWRSLGSGGGTEFETRSIYDSAGREVKRTEHTPQSDQVSTWEYTPEGYLLAAYVNYPFAGVLYTYGALGRLLSTQKVRDARLYSIEFYGYDEADHRLEATEFGSDGLVYTTSIFQYHDNGVMRFFAQYLRASGGERSQTFDPAGRLLGENDSAGFGAGSTSSTYAYDAQGRLTMHESTATQPRGEGSQVRTTRFNYDAQGRLMLQDELSDNTFRGQTEKEHHTLVFQYAPQLVRVDQFDENGVREGSRELSYDASGRLTQERFSGAMAQQQDTIRYTYPPCAAREEGGSVEGGRVEARAQEGR